MSRFLKIYADSFRGLSLESWMLSIVMLINRTGSMVLPFLGVYMIDKLHFTLSDSGLVLACFGIGSVVGSSLGGWITDKFGEYSVQALSLFLSVPMFCLYPLYETPISLGLMVLLQSIVSEVFRPANSVAISKYATSSNLTRAFSLNRMAVNLGFSVGPALGGLLAAYSYNLLFFGNGFFTLAAGVMYIYFFRRRQKLFKIRAKRKRAQEQEAPPPTAKERSPYTDSPFLVFCLMCAFFSICFFQLLNTLPLFYKDELHLSQKTIGLLMGANGFVVVLFEMLLVHLAETKLTAAKTLFYGTILCALSFLLLAFEPNIAVLLLSVSLLSLGEILVLPFMATITAQRSGQYNKGAYMGVNGMAFSISLIVAPILGTSVAGKIGFSNLWIGTTAVLLVCAFSFKYYVPILIGKTAKQQ